MLKPIESGHSLCELLAVLFILSCAGGVSVLAARSLLVRPRLGMESRELLATLSAVEQRSLSTGRAVSLDFDERTLFEVSSTAEGGEIRRPLLELHRGITVQRAAFGAGGKSTTRAVFYGNGVASPGSITIVDGSGRRCVITQSIRGARHCECEE